MLKIHPDAKPIYKKGTTEQIGWMFENRSFSFEAVQDPEGTVSVYIEWGDGLDGDIVGFEDWSETERYLLQLLKDGI